MKKQKIKNLLEILQLQSLKMKLASDVLRFEIQHENSEIENQLLNEIENQFENIDKISENIKTYYENKHI